MTVRIFKFNQLIPYKQLLELITQLGTLDQPFTTKSVVLHFCTSIYKALYCLGAFHTYKELIEFKYCNSHQG